MVIGSVSLLLFAFVLHDLFGCNENFVSADPLPKLANHQNFHQQQKEEQQQSLIDTEEDDDEILVRVRKSPDARPDPRGGRGGGSRGRFRGGGYRGSRYSGNGGGSLSTGAILGIVFGTLGGTILLGVLIYCFCA